MPEGLNDDSMETQLTLEADQYIPYPLEEVSIDFEVQGSCCDARKSRCTMLAACRRETIDSRADAINESGLEAKDY